MLKTFSSIATAAARAYKARSLNSSFTVTDHCNRTSKVQLMDFLKELETRTALLGEDDANRMNFNAMVYSLSRIFNIAVNDFEAFCNDYECTIWYNDSLKESECFKVYVKEKNALAPADWEVRFNNLKKI